MNLNYPYVAPWYQFYLEENKCVFKNGETIIVFEGEAVKKILSEILPLMDGYTEITTIMNKFDNTYIEPIINALNMLEEKGIILEFENIKIENTRKNQEKSLQYYMEESLDSSLKDLKNKIDMSVIGIISKSNIGEVIARELQKMGCKVELIENCIESPLEMYNIVIFCDDEKTHSYLFKWNERAIEEKKTWFHVKYYDGESFEIGPMFVPMDTACYVCMNIRKKSNIDYLEEYENWEEAYLENKIFNKEVRPVIKLENTVSEILSLHVIKKLLGLEDGALINEYYSISTDIMEGIKLSKHPVYRVPRCPVCSKLSSQSPLLPWYEVSADA